MLCFLVFLCCLHFRVWKQDHRVKKISFLLIFFSPFLTLTLFFLFFSFEPLVLLPCLAILSYCLKLLPHCLAMPCVASSCYLIALSCCHVASVLSCQVAFTFASCCLIAFRYLAYIAPQVPFNPLICCFIALLPRASLPCVGWYFLSPSSFARRSCLEK